MMKKIIDKIYHNRVFSWLFPTTVYCLRKSLKDCETVLDLGCGPSSPLQYCKNIKYSVGVEVFKPYLEESRRRRIHTEYIEKRIEEVNFPENSFDAVILIEVLEHLPKETGYYVLEKASIWTKKRIVVSTPRGYFPVGNVDQNEYQRHRSGWSVKDLEMLDFKVNGLGGSKFFYEKENKVYSLVESPNVFENIRFKPKALFYAINAFLQMITYYFPEKAFGLIASKEIENE